MPGANIGSGSCTVNGVATLGCIFPLLVSFIVWALTFASVVALFMIILAGFRYLTSGGDPKTLDSARKTLTYAILGLAIVFLSFLILSLVAQITGVACINPSFPINSAYPFSACSGFGGGGNF